MALSTCRECHQAVSTDANRCPSCGVKLPTPEALARDARRGNWHLLAGALLIAAAVGGLLLYQHHRMKEDQERARCDVQHSLGLSC